MFALTPALSPEEREKVAAAMVGTISPPARFSDGVKSEKLNQVFNKNAVRWVHGKK
jgi:hypothetical protein